jgi:hypothetical protein
MTGPDHYRRAEELLAEASELNRFRPQLKYSGPDDIPMRDTDMEQRRRLSEDPGLPRAGHPIRPKDRTEVRTPRLAAMIAAVT